MDSLVSTQSLFCCKTSRVPPPKIKDDEICFYIYFLFKDMGNSCFSNWLNITDNCWFQLTPMLPPTFVTAT